VRETIAKRPEYVSWRSEFLAGAFPKAYQLTSISPQVTPNKANSHRKISSTLLYRYG